MKRNPKYRPVKKKRGLSRKERKANTAAVSFWKRVHSAFRESFDKGDIVLPFSQKHVEQIEEGTRELIKMFGPAPEGEQQYSWFKTETK